MQPDATNFEALTNGDSYCQLAPAKLAVPKYTYAFLAPLTSNASDTVPPAASGPTVTGAPAYGASGATMAYSGSTWDALSFASTNTKLNASGYSSRTKFSCLVTTNSCNLVTGNSVRIFGTSSGSLEVAFLVAVVSGALRVYAWEYLGGALTYDLGPLPSTALLEFEWVGSTGLTYFINGTAVRSTTFARPQGGIYFGLGNLGATSLNQTFANAAVLIGP